MQFQGFKPEAMQRIAGTMGYNGDMSKFGNFLNENPNAKKQMNMFNQKAVSMMNGGLATRNYHTGGVAGHVHGPDNPDPDATTTQMLNLGQTPAYTGEEVAVKPVIEQIQQLDNEGNPVYKQVQSVDSNNDPVFINDPNNPGEKIPKMETSTTEFEMIDKPQTTVPQIKADMIDRTTGQKQKTDPETGFPLFEADGITPIMESVVPEGGLATASGTVFKQDQAIDSGTGSLKTQAKDAQGNPLFEADGVTPKMEDAGIKARQTLAQAGKPKLDSAGNPVLDAEGNPVMEGAQVIDERQLDAEGNPIISTADTALTGGRVEQALKGGPRDMDDPRNIEALKTIRKPFEDKQVELKAAFENLSAFGILQENKRVTAQKRNELARLRPTDSGYDANKKRFLEQIRELQESQQESVRILENSPEKAALDKNTEAAQAEIDKFLGGNEGVTAAVGTLSEDAKVKAQEGTTSKTSFDGEAMLAKVDKSILPPGIKYNAETGNFDYQQPDDMPRPRPGEPLPEQTFSTISLTPQEVATKAGMPKIELDEFTTEGSLARTLGVDEKFIQEVVAGTRTVTDEEIAAAAKRSGTPAADILSMIDVTKAKAAKFEGDTPEVTAVTEYTDLDAEAASREVQANELAKAEGIGLDAEQAGTVSSEYASTLEAAKGKVAAGEIVETADYYNLPATDIAEIKTTSVQDAAKSSEYTSADAAKSGYESDVSGVQGRVGANELANANDILATAKAVEATAATMNALDAASMAVAVQGSLAQTSLATPQTGVVETKATMQGQMTSLMQQFDNGTPAWAAGAMRAANAAMAARGMGGSSMAASAIVQATMESAIPIAQADAQTFAQMSMTNLNNRQQVSLANAAASQNMELANLNNLQQSMLQNSSNNFARQSANLSNSQGVVLANAQFKSALQGKTIDVKTQTSLTNAARYAESNNINLSNSQQAILQRSSENLTVETANLSSESSTALANLQVRAALVGQELTNEQQSAMLQSSQDFEGAKFDASAKQQAFLQDAQATAALEGKSMDIRQQTLLFNASRIAEVNDINLTNEQAVALQKSAENMQVELANLSNEQQTSLANAQLRASLQGKVLDNKQQVAILNAAKYAEVNNINLSNEQEAFVQEFATKSAMEGKVLDNKQQAAIFNISAELDERKIELDNEQKTRLFNTANKQQMEIADVSNRQQAALANAQIDAVLEGKELDNRQQVAVLEAEKYAEAANMTFTAEQKTALHNSELMKTIGLAEMSTNATIALQNAATVANMDMANLNNRQQAEVLNAQAFLNIDMTNLNNEQQTMLFKAQAMQQSILTDAAAENASNQFNATSQNQSDQFFSNLKTNIDQFNTSQATAISQVNAGEANALSKFNTEVQNQRDQFEASNEIVIAQSNVVWRREIATADTAAVNRANEINATNVMDMSNQAYANLWQEHGDLMEWAWSSADNQLDRQNAITLSHMSRNETMDALELKQANAASSAMSSFVTKALLGSLGIDFGFE